jgi:hypothetical protein
MTAYRDPERGAFLLELVENLILEATLGLKLIPELLLGYLDC